MLQGTLGVDAVPISATDPLPFDVPLGLEIRKHTVRLTLGETGPLSDLANSRVWLPRHLHENRPVRGDERPFRVFWHALECSVAHGRFVKHGRGFSPDFY
jgi:hypothetical protein